MAITDGLISWWPFGDAAAHLVDHGSFAAAQTVTFADRVGVDFPGDGHDGQYGQGAVTYAPNNSINALSAAADKSQIFSCADESGIRQQPGSFNPQLPGTEVRVDPQLGHNAEPRGDVSTGTWFQPRFGWTLMIMAAPFPGYYIERVADGIVPRTHLVSNSLTSATSTTGWDIQFKQGTVPQIPTLFTQDGLNNPITHIYGPTGEFVFHTPGGQLPRDLTFGDGVSIDQQYRYLVVTYDGTTFRTYMDVEQQDELVAPFPASLGPTLRFGSRYNAGADDGFYGTPFSGSFDECLMWNRAITPTEVAHMPDVCKLVARIHHKITVSVNNDAPPNRVLPRGDEYTNQSDGSAGPTTQKSDGSLFGFAGRQLPDGHEFPPYPYQHWGANMYSAPRNGASEGVFDWPHGRWVQMFFPYDEFLYHTPGGGGIITLPGWDLPDVDSFMGDLEEPQYWGPNNTLPTGHTDTYPHWFVTGGECVPPFDPPTDTYETGVLDPTEWATNPVLYPHVYQEGAFVTTGHHTFTCQGQVSIPNRRDYPGQGVDFIARRNATFAARVRETTTNTVVSLVRRSGYDMSFYTAGLLGLMTGSIDPHAAVGQMDGLVAWSKAPYGAANIEAGRRFVVELYQTTGVDLEVEAYGNFALYAHTRGIDPVQTYSSGSFPAILP